MTVSLERELKLDPPPGFELPPLEGSPLESRLFTSTYHDTPGLSLARAGITLRRRLENGKSRWQLKLPRDDGARAEIEVAGGPAGPPARLRDLLLTHLRHGALAPAATLRTRRTGVLATKDEQPIAEVTVDTVSILEGAHSLGGFTELEIELVGRGGKGDLKRLQADLRRGRGQPFGRSSQGLSRARGCRRRRTRNSPSPREPRSRSRRSCASSRRTTRACGSVTTRRTCTRCASRPAVRAHSSVRRRRTTMSSLRSRTSSSGSPAYSARYATSTCCSSICTALAADLGTDREAAESLVATLAGERTVKRVALIEALDSERYFALLDALAVAFAGLLDDAGRR